MPQSYQSSGGTASYTIESPRRHTQRLMQFNQDMFQRNVLTDIECVVEGQVFQAHRALLVCFSPYLKKKLINAEGKPIAKRIYIPKIGINEFEILLRYMYSGNVEVNCNNFFDVYQAASLLEMEDAKAECLQLIDGRDEIRTYFYSYVLSKKLGVEHSIQKALKLITHRFEESVFSKEFMQLDVKYVIEILSAQTIGARSETIVFLAALNWLNQDYGNRIDHAVPVMGCVRFSSMSVEEIVACFHPPFLPHVVQIPEVLMMLYRATCYIAAKTQGRENWFKQYASLKRNLVLEDLPMELWHKQQSHSSTTLANSRQGDSSVPPYHHNRTEQWLGFPESVKSKTPTSVNREDLEKKHLEEFPETDFKFRDAPYSDAQTHGSRLDKKSDQSDKVNSERIASPVIKKGFDGSPETTYINIPDSPYVLVPKIMHPAKGPLKCKQEKTDEIKISGLDKEKEQAKIVQSSEKEISGKKALKDDGCILVVGGMNPRNFRKDTGESVYILNVNKNDWLHYTNLPEPRHNHCAAYLDNTLYVTGGCKPQETIEKNRYVAKRSCFKLDLKSLKWSAMPDMLCARYDHGMAVYKGHLIAFGGEDEKGRLLKSVETFNPEKNKWKSLDSNMCCGRKSMGVAVYNDRIWIAGGLIQPKRRAQLQLASHVDSYYPEEQKWYFNSYLLPSPRCLCCLVEWEGKLYCIGGLIQINNEKLCPTNEVWFVDGENQLWKQGPFLPEPRMGGVAVKSGKNLYYLGGYDPENNNNPQNVIYLTPGATSWNIGPRMITDIFGLSAC